MLYKILANKNDYVVFEGYKYDVVMPNSMAMTDNLGVHVVIWATASQLIESCKDTILAVLTNSETILAVDNACEQFSKNSQRMAILGGSFNRLVDFINSQITYDKLVIHTDLNSKLNLFQQEFYDAFKKGSIIHIYDCNHVNDQYAKPPNNILEKFGYKKLELYSTSNISAYLFYPIHDIAITPLHSHHTTRSLTSSFACYEIEISSKFR